MATAARYAAGALVHAIRAEDLQEEPHAGCRIVGGSLDQFSGKSVVAIGSRLAERLHIKRRRYRHADPAAEQLHGPRLHPALEDLRRDRDLRGRHVHLRRADRLHAARGRPAVLPGQERGDARSSSTSTIPTTSFAIGRAIFEATGARFRIIDWQQQYAGYFAWLDVQRNVLALILAAHHGGRRAQRHLRPGAAGARQDARDRHPPHHGRHARAPSCASS